MSELIQEVSNGDHQTDSGQLGDQIGGNKIVVGDIADSYAAIGEGAQVIISQIQQALSSVDEMEKSIQVAERRLAEAIQRLLERFSALTAEDAIDEYRNPYKSLEDYKLEDAPYFYGREDAIAAMREKMRHGRLAILESDSGSGKSSLLQAGLASRLLAEKNLPLYVRAYNQPPGQVIKKAFLRDYATLEELSRFRDENMDLPGFLDRVTHYLGDRQLIIFLDQFEEFFTVLPPEDQEEFAHQLQQCVQSDLPVRWVLAIRKEYLTELRLFEMLQPFNNKYFLPTFEIEEAHDVIVEPAAMKGVRYESDLVDQILADIGRESESIPPVQVQLVCYTLFDELMEEDDASLITYALYEKPRGRGVGRPGAQGILTSHLTRVLDNQLTGEERRTANLILEALVTSDLRRVVKSKEKLSTEIEPSDPQMFDHALKVLSENRILRRSLNEEDQPVYELTHDYLLNEITLDPETQALKAAQESLAQELVDYKRYGTLLSNDKFEIINNRRRDLNLDPQSQHLLEQSEKALTRRSRLARTLATLTLMILAVLTSSAIYYAVQSNYNATEAKKNLITASTAQAQAEADALHAEEQALRAVAAEEDALDSRDEAEVASTRATNQEALAQAERDRATQFAFESLSKSLAGNANDLANDDFPLALLLAVQANKFAQTPQSLSSLINLLGQDEQTARVSNIGNTIQGRNIATISEGEIAIDPTNNSIITGQNYLRKWEADTFEFLDDIPLEYSKISCVAVEPASKTLAICSGESALVTIWDLEREELVKELKYADDLLDIEYGFYLDGLFTPDGTRFIASGAVSNDILIWDVGSGELLEILSGHTYYVRALDVSPDGKYLASGSSDNSAIIWDIERGTQIERLLGHRAPVGAVAFSPDQSKIVTADQAGYVLIRDANTFKLLESISLSGSNIDALSFSPDGQLLMLSTAEQLRQWSIPDGEELPRLPKVHSSGVQDILFTDDGSQMFTIGADANIVAWNLSNSSPIGSRYVEHPGTVWAAEISKDAKMAATGDQNGNIIIWDLTTQEPTRKHLVSHETTVQDLAFSPDGRLLASGGEDGNLVIWDTARGVAIDQPIAQDGFVSEVAFSDDGQYLATGTQIGLPEKRGTLPVYPDIEGGTVTIYKVGDTGGLSLVGNHKFQNQIAGLDFNDDSSLLTASSFQDAKVHIIRLEDNSQVKSLDVRPTIYDGNVFLIAPSGVNEVTFLPDSNKVAFSFLLFSPYTYGVEGGLAVWDTDSGEVIKSVAPDFMPTAKIRFDELGETIYLSGGKFIGGGLEDPRIRLLDSKTLEKRAEIMTPHIVRSLAVVPGDESLLAGDEQGGTTFLSVDPEVWLQMGCDMLNRNLSADEWRIYVGDEVDYTATCAQYPIEDLPEDLSSAHLVDAVLQPPDFMTPTPVLTPITGTTNEKDPLASSGEGTPAPQLVVPIETESITQGKFTTNLVNKPAGLELEVPAIIQCRSEADSDEFVNQYFASWILSENRQDEGIGEKTIQVQLKVPETESSDSHPANLTFRLGDHGMLMSDTTIARHVMISPSDEIPTFELNFDQLPWEPSNQNDYPEDGFPLVEITGFHPFGNPQYPQHRLGLRVQQSGPYYFANAYVVVTDKKGDTVDILARQGGDDIISTNEDVFITFLSSLTESGRCVGPSNDEGYDLHILLIFANIETERRYTKLVKLGVAAD